MKWKNKGHEFDDEAKLIMDNMKRCQERFSLFGAGRYARGRMNYFDHLGTVECFIDNDPNKQSAYYLGKEVLSLEQFITKGISAIIIIATSPKYSGDISEQLDKFGLKHGRDYYCMDEFFQRIIPVYMAYNYGRVFMELAQICVTERCTLRCRKCAHGCYAVSAQAPDMSLDEIKNNVDVFFKRVFFIMEFVLIGGEPLLHKELTHCIDYIGEKYRDRIGIFSITTNGTILPGETLLSSCKKNRAIFRISNYTCSLPNLKSKYEAWVDLLIKNGIEFTIQDVDLMWYDYGFEYVNYSLEEDLCSRFDACKTPCRDVHDGKLFYCVMARSVSDNLGYGVGTGEGLDLSSLPEGAEGAKVLLEFNQGFSTKGYLDMCGRCHGAEVKKYIIPAAEQLE